jgi:hypothetical protein
LFNSRTATKREAIVTTLLAPTKSLTAADRCDRCGAQAYVRVVLTAGELLFCAHHGRRYEEKLREVAREFDDQSAQLKATPNSAPDDER